MKKLAMIAGVMMLSILFSIQSVAAEAKDSYEVVKGDNLWNIAKKYQTTVEFLLSINDLKSSTIYPEQTLRLAETYTVEKGDTLIGIGKKFDVTVEEIMEWNDLDSTLILIDQELIIRQTNDVFDEKERDHSRQATVDHNNAVETATSSENEKPEGKTLTVRATAYTAECDGCSGITYTGVNLLQDRQAKVIAVDPNVIPLGSKVYVEGYGYATAEDIGGAIKGNRIDIHLPTREEALQWGVREVNVTILD